METTTHTAYPIVEEDITRCTTPLSGTERENQYLLVITTSVGQLNWDPVAIIPKDLQLIHMMKTPFQNPWMAATFPGSTRTVSYGGTLVKELNE